MKSSILGWFDSNRRNRQIFGPSLKTKIIIFLIVLLLACGVVYYHFGDSIFSNDGSADSEKEVKKDIDAKAEKNDNSASEQAAKEAADNNAASQANTQTAPQEEVQPTPEKTICMLKPDKSDTDFDVESLVDMDLDYTDTCRKRLADKKQAVKDAKKFLVDADIAYDKALRDIEKAQNNIEAALNKVKEEKANLLQMQEDCKNIDTVADAVNDTVENTTSESN